MQIHEVSENLTRRHPPSFRKLPEDVLHHNEGGKLERGIRKDTGNREAKKQPRHWKREVPGRPRQQIETGTGGQSDPSTNEQRHREVRSADAL